MTFNSFHLKTLKYELCNKFAYKNISELPKLKKIILNFGCRTADLKHLSASLLALELITCQKGRITTTKSPNLLLKIKKGNPSRFKVTLKKKQMLNFLLKMIINVFPKIKNFSKNSLMLVVSDVVFDKNDYMQSFDEFKSLVNEKK